MMVEQEKINREKIDREWAEYSAKMEERQHTQEMADYYVAKEKADLEKAYPEKSDAYIFGHMDGIIEGYVVGYAHAKKNLKPLYKKNDVNAFRHFKEGEIKGVNKIKKLSQKDLEILALESVSQHEVDYFREKTLPQMHVPEDRLLKRKNMKSLKLYIADNKLSMIMQLMESTFHGQVFGQHISIGFLVYRVLIRLSYYLLEEILENNELIIKLMDSSECYGSTSETQMTKDLASQRKYKAAYLLATAPRWIILIYKPELEKDEEWSLFTIAHELAHRCLKHAPEIQLPPQGSNWEDEADALAEKWGFKKPEKLAPLDT